MILDWKPRSLPLRVDRDAGGSEEDSASRTVWTIWRVWWLILDLAAINRWPRVVADIEVFGLAQKDEEEGEEEE